MQSLKEMSYFTFPVHITIVNLVSHKAIGRVPRNLCLTQVFYFIFSRVVNNYFSCLKEQLLICITANVCL